jgi:hypothetical protein
MDIITPDVITPNATIGVIGNGLTITFGDEYNVSDYRSYYKQKQNVFH